MMQRILLLAPHPDDGEFSCGASLKKWSDEGIQIWYAAFSPCKKSVPAGFEKDVLYKELVNATHELGIPSDHIITYDFPVREFPSVRQDILEALIQLRKEIQPDLVLLPNTQDIHQDHQVISAEGIRAFKHRRLMGYELPWNSFSFTNSCHVQLERDHIAAKIKAVMAYKSQEFRTYHDEEFFYGLAKTRGIQIGVNYAEAFEMIRWIM